MRLRSARYRSGLERTLFKEERLWAAGARTSARRITIIIGRAAAAKAVRSAGIKPQPLLPRAGTRLPLWPRGCVGSIAHSAAVAVAAAADARRVLALGVDIQRIRPSDPGRLVKRICSPDEAAWATEREDLLPKRAIMLFTAKEALFKLAGNLGRSGIPFNELKITPSGLCFKVCPAAVWRKGEAQRIRIAVDSCRGWSMAIAMIPAQ